MKKKDQIYYDALLVLSYNAIFTMIITNRNYGKTWCLKRRAFKRAIKHDYKTIWIRTFEEEVKECTRTFFTNSKLRKFCGVEMYDKKKNSGNVKQIGRTFYYRRHKGDKWKWFIHVVLASKANSMRGVDDPKCDTIVYDEFTSTIAKQNLYRGDVVTDFIDIFYSTKRDHMVRCIFLGNKECVINPFYNYFHIKPLPQSFEGIKTFREGSIAIEQRNNIPRKSKSTDYDHKLEALLKGTAYGRYLYEGSYKNAVDFKKRKTPYNAMKYAQLEINGYKIKISYLNGYFYVANTLDELDVVYVLQPINKYKKERLLVKRQKREFISLINALADSVVYYDNEATYEAIQPLYQWLNV